MSWGGRERRHFLVSLATHKRAAQPFWHKHRGTPLPMNPLGHRPTNDSVNQSNARDGDLSKAAGRTWAAEAS